MRKSGILDGTDRCGGVGQLVTAYKARHRQIHQSVLVLINHAAMLFAGVEILRIDRHRAAQSLGRFDQHIARGAFGLRANHDRTALLDDARLFGSDQFYPVTEIGFMIHRDRHDQGNGWFCNHVGCIKTPA